MNPSDLAAIRALTERAGISCQAIRPLVPAAKEALGRVESTSQHTELSTSSDYCAYDQCHVSECSHSGLHGYITETEAVLAQSARDVAYWRKRAETADALAVWQETRLTRLEQMLRTWKIRLAYIGHPQEPRTAEGRPDWAQVVGQTDAALGGRDA